MDSIFLGINTLISGWITALLIAILSVYFLGRTELFDSIVNRLERTTPNEFVFRNSRWLVALTIVISLGLFFSILMSLEPDQDGLVLSLLKNRTAETTWNQYYFIVDDILIAFGVLLIIALIPTINFIFSRIFQKINHYRNTRFRVIKFQNLEIFTPNRMVGVLVLITKYFHQAIIFLIGMVFLTLVFSLYPQTEGFVHVLMDKMNLVLSEFWKKTLALLPNLFALVVITTITRLALRLLRFFYNGLQQGKIRFSAIHPEVVEPTYQLSRFLVIAFALVAAFPYIPGSSSPVFKGLSIFVGFLLSLGSTSLITNIISGIVLTYSRGLKIGDRVQIGDTVGDVIDRTLLITRVRTIKNVIITIPNVMVMQNQIVNYSAEARDAGLILHTSVTIGYDEPWRNVQKLLISAAQETADIIENPKPFVLKTNLNNHHVSYELNAFTRNPVRMADIYSDLHQNILDKFNQAEVEILSPTYFAFRDGQDSTIHQVELSGNGNGRVSRKYESGNTYSSYREKTQPQGSR
jgi:small-conductance mechanosensitive channel